MNPKNKPKKEMTFIDQTFIEQWVLWKQFTQNQLNVKPLLC